MVKPDVDTLLTVPDDPPAAGPDRALDPPPPELLLAAGEALLEVALTIPEEQPATAMAAPPATMDMVSLRENIDTGGPLGRAMVVIVGAIAELEKSLIVERVKAGMRRAKLEGRRIGRAPLNVDRVAIVRDRLAGLSLTKVAKRYRVSRATVCRLVNESGRSTKTEGRELARGGTQTLRNPKEAGV